ncbi:MAG TPA: hypothetical protein VFY24_11255, partial [Azospira sp.]|nr:hypothetical protein [Azospira sp.]
MNHEQDGAVMRGDLSIAGDGAMAQPVPRAQSVPRAPGARGGEGGSDAASRIAVRVGHGPGELLALEPAWRALLASLPRPLFVHAFEWQRAYLECLANDPEATCYISLFDGSRAIAIFPLRRVRRR